MLVILVTNSVLIHQYYLCKALTKEPDIDFKLIVSEPPANLSNQKTRLFDNCLHFNFDIIRSYESDAERTRAIELIKEADMCIFGAEDHSLLKGIKRPCFRYSEHFNKWNLWFFHPKTFLRIPKMYRRYRNEQQGSFLLCASYYAKRDFNLCGLYRNHCLKFGYFPQGNIENSLTNKKFPVSKQDELKLVFVGRSINWKHPDISFYALRKLRAKGLNCSLTFISLPSKLRERIFKKYKQEIDGGFVKVYDELPPKNIMSIFAESHLFIFSSDQGEGFGATLYEAMTSKVAVIANARAGATNLLAKDGENGFVYKTKRQLDGILDNIAENPSILEKVASGAKQFTEEKYNAKVAAHNLVEFVRSGCTKSFPDDEPISKL